MAPGALFSPRYRASVAEALALLGKRNLVLGIHAASFPADPDEDLGRGSPYGKAGRRFVSFVRALGFTGLQLGPPGQLSVDNPSPYDSTLFARSTLDVALTALVGPGPFGGLLPPEALARAVAARPPGPPERTRHAYAFATSEALLRAAFARLRQQREEGPTAFPFAELQAFTAAHRGWLEVEALYVGLCRLHGAPYWREWRQPDGTPHPDQRLLAPAPGERALQATRLEALRAAFADEVAFQAFGQYLWHTQHAALRRHAGALGLKLYGDLQIGYAAQDMWALQALFLAGYRMGAPPSRTNLDGQPWNYPVLDPAQYRTALGEEGPVLRLVAARMEKMLEEFDGVRLDHPHGLVDPWVYRADMPDALQAVQQGARLFSSPHVADHPALAAFALVRPDQLADPLRTPRYADGWVQGLSEAQVERYACLFDTVVSAARRHGRSLSDLVCEVLSTCPYPLARVLAREGLGRFRVTQKANPVDPSDVYRSENAAPEDWVMVGNHDTLPLARVLEGWARSPDTWQAQADLLARQLEPTPSRRAALATWVAADPRHMWDAKLADLFASRARNVLVFFSDLYGLRDVYNTPGTVSPANWSLRLPADAERVWAERLARGEGLNLPRVLALALRARGPELVRGQPGLLAALEEEAEALARPPS